MDYLEKASISEISAGELDSDLLSFQLQEYLHVLRTGASEQDLNWVRQNLFDLNEKIKH